MSYDLVLFRIAEGVEARDAYDELMSRQEEELEKDENRTPSAGELDQIRAVAGALKTWHPGFQEFVCEEGFSSIDLTEEDLQVQFGVYGDSVLVSMPYFRDDAGKMMEFVGQSFGVIQARTGYVVYDPQIERLVTADDLKEMAGRYRKMDDLLPKIVQKTREKEKPWWKFW